MTTEKQKIYSFYQNSFGELYTINSLVSIILKNFTDLENKCEFYGTSGSMMQKLSKERHDCMNALEILYEKINHIMQLYLDIENEINL